MGLWGVSSFRKKMGEKREMGGVVGALQWRGGGAVVA
jgi:hypothetical protein